MKGQPIAYLPQELAWIEAQKDVPRRELHAMFCAQWGRDDVSIDNLKALCKRMRWFTGRTGHYVKGQPAYNKGKKMPYHPNSAGNRFKKGHRPHTWRGPGHEAVGKDGYVWLIVAETNPHTGADTRRVMKHSWLWIKKNGPVPEGMALKCLDGDKTNTDPSNWRPVPRALLPRLNGRFGRGYDNAPDDLKPTIMAVTELEHAARETLHAKDRS